MNASNSDPAIEGSVPPERVESPPVLLPNPTPKKPVSLAKRISSRTTDLLAIAIVLIGSLTLGRQILEWWRADPPPVLDAGPLANLDTEWGADGKPVQLEFADSPLRLIRQTAAVGGPLVALGFVQETCQTALLVANPPESPPDQHERDMLKLVLGHQPEVEQPGIWQIHRLGGNMVTLIGVHFFPMTEQKTDRSDGATVPRVVCWGLVFPGGSSGSWTAYTFVKTHRKSLSSDSTSVTPVTSKKAAEFDLGQVVLPKGCHRILLVHESAWNSLLGFQGNEQASDWRQHFSDWFAGQGWTLVEDWQSGMGTTGWSASFTKDDEKSMNSNRVLIQIQFDEAGQGSGLIHGLPGTAKK